MDRTTLDRILSTPASYTEEADALLQAATVQFASVQAFSKHSPQYCAKETHLEQARAIHRAVTAILAQQSVKFSDMATLKGWLYGYIAMQMPQRH